MYRPSIRRSAAPRGQAAIIVALALVLLTSCAALGIDGARFYAEGLRVQKAADEAALAAVVQGSISGTDAVTATAQDLVSRNLPLAAGATDTVSATYTTAPVGQVKVVLQEQNFPFLFAPVFGLKAGSLTREATAQYNAPVPMGNPSNTLGFPTSPITTYQPDPSGNPVSATVAAANQNLVLSINGPDQWSESGDPYAPLYVLSDPAYVSGAPSIPNPFRPAGFNGYDYKLTIPSGSSGATYLQIYDAETCQGDAFGDSVASGQYGLPYTSQSMNYPVSYSTQYATYVRLYWLNPTTGTHDPVPAGNFLTTARGPVIPGVITNTLPANTVIAPTDGWSGASAPYTCDSTFRDKWYTLAKVDGARAGSYIVNITTCLDTSNRGSNGYSFDGHNLTNCEGSEVNNFALRAVTVDPSTFSCDNANGLDCQNLPASPQVPLDRNGQAIPQPQVAGVGRISIQVQSAGNSLIYLAKIDPIYKGKWLLIKLYDPGDLSGASSMQIVRPDGTYAPFEWYTETLDGAGRTFQTALQNNQSQSLITSFPAASQPSYTTPYSGTTPLCPSQNTSGLVPAGAPAFGQSMAEDNPFDPLHTTVSCVGANDYHQWDDHPWDSPQTYGQPNRPPSPSWLTSGPPTSADTTYQTYNLLQNGSNSNYRPYNGRWVYIFTQIPTNYDTTYNPAANPNPGWWYVQYKTQSSAAFTDRTVWETTIIDTPPHLVN